ncbi:periplasmic binding protein-like I [Obelidium mucronatum]|nr:periplasmic binding protein-like I [Obelidium mucronatum]
MFEDIVDRSPDVIGVIGNEYSTTARGPAQALSLRRIPYCSGASGSPRLSDKNKYPYFFRTMTALGIGEHMFQVLKQWKVGRVAILYQGDDELGRYSAVDIVGSMNRNGVSLPTGFGTSELKYAMRMIAEFAMGSMSFLGACIRKWGCWGWSGPQFVWMGFIPISVDLGGLLDSNRVSLEGFILFQQMLPDTTKPMFKAFEDSFFEISGVDYNAISQYDMSTYFAPQFDCTMMMLVGIDKLLKSSPSVSISDLLNHDLQSHMNSSFFQNLGYSGVIADPVILNNFGDLSIPYQVFYYTGNYNNITVFGQTNTNGTDFYYYDSVKPVFFGGSSIPPPDGPIVIVHPLFSLQVYFGPILLAMSAAGILLCLSFWAFLLKYRRHILVKSLGVDYTSVSILGAALGYIWILTEAAFLTETTCKLRIWLLVLSFAVILVPLMIKNIYIWIIFRAVEQLDIESIQKRLYCVTAGLVAIDVMLLGLWNYRVESRLELISLQFYDVYRCRYISKDKSSLQEIVLYVYNISLLALLIPLTSMLRNIGSNWNESALLSIILFLYVFTFGFIYLLPMNTDVYNDLRRCVSVFILITMTLLFVVGSRVYIVWRDKWVNNDVQQNMFRNLNRISNVVRNRRSSVARPLDLTGYSGRNSFSIRNSSGGGGGGSTVLAQSMVKHSEVQRLLDADYKYYFRSLPSIQLFKIRKNRTFWSRWKKGLFSFHILVGRDRCWLTIANPEEHICFPMFQAGQGVKDEAKITENLSRVSIKWGKFCFPLVSSPCHELLVEFPDEDEAHDFVQVYNELMKLIIK